MDWTEIKVTVPLEYSETAAAIVSMATPYGIYVEDYSDMEENVKEIAHIDLIDGELLKKDRKKAVIHIYISPEENPLEALSFIEERLTSENIPYETDSSLIKNEDWENNWKKYFKPFKIGEKLLIKPAWEEIDDACGRAVLNIEPGLAFGSGTHETTKLCLTALEKYINENSKVLDIGSGSGILSIASLLLGAKSALGVDIDKLAVKTAKENALRNGFDESKFKVVLGNLTDKVSGKYDVILANIVADAIIRLSEDVGDFMSENGVFITSGIIDERQNEVETALFENGFKIIDKKEENGWALFTAVLK